MDTVLSKISPKKLEVIKYADANCNCIYLLFVQTKKGMKLKRQIPITLNEQENHLHKTKRQPQGFAPTDLPIMHVYNETHDRE